MAAGHVSEYAQLIQCNTDITDKRDEQKNNSKSEVNEDFSNRLK